ncbi:MAG: DUF3592 domain-containing protein [Cyclobacteriaceae bacterium]
MKKPGIVNLLMAGVGGVLLIITFNQYIINAQSLEDYGIYVTAEVIEMKIEEWSIRRGSSSQEYYYNVGIPVIQYEVEGETYTSEVTHWGSSIDEEVHSSNPLMVVGDQVKLLVNPGLPDVFIKEGERDPTNWVGFIIWGGIGTVLLTISVRRMRGKS